MYVATIHLWNNLFSMSKLIYWDAKKLLVCRKIHRSTKKVSFPALLLQNWYLTKKILSAWSHKNKLFLDESYRFWSSDTIVLWRSLSLLFWALNVFSLAKATKHLLVLKTFLTFVVSLRLLKSNSWQKTLVLLNNFFLFVSRKTCNLSIVLIRNILIESLY